MVTIHTHQTTTSSSECFSPEEEHRRDEAAGSRVLREHVLCPEAGRAGRARRSGAGPETDQDQAGPGSEELETTPGPGHQEHWQHPDSTEQEPRGREEGLIEELALFKNIVTEGL